MMRNEGTTVRRMLLFVMASIAGIACPSPRRVAPPPPPPTPRVGLATPRAGVPPSPTARVAPASRLRVTGPREVSVFATIELAVSPPAGLLGERGRDGRTDGEIHDAYDANRDGRSLRLIARFSREGVVGKAAPGKAAPGNKVITVPGFAARDRPGGPWRFRVRWSPRRAGRWRARISLYLDGKEHIATLAHTIRARVDPTLAGPLIAPTRAAPRYLRCLAADGTSKARWLFGAARAWVVHHGRHAKLTGWARSSQLDREHDLLAPMRAAGENLLNQWMAPWEYLLVHHDRTEYWRQNNGTWRRYPLPTETAWTPYRAFDQGRAHAFDALVRSCEGGPKHPPVYLLLSPLPHQTLQMRHHPWGAQESGWSPTDDGGKQDPSKLNGFSGYRRGMSAWQFFLASPRAPKGDECGSFQSTLVTTLRWRFRVFPWSGGTFPSA
ncbi:MAG: hypothetical protein KAI47_01655 [Deltaproteobacteria bacterium]|nr:hypothetical protein [Deltaproteobacteria bacterium]